MRVAVMGTGGLGGCIGGLLAHAGEDVSLIARGANLEALRAKGLTVKSIPAGEFNLPLFATNDPADIGSVDLVLFCVKTYDTDGAAEQIRPLIGSDTIVLSTQNGVDGADRIASVIGYEHVLGAISTVNAHLEAPGVVVQHLNHGMEIGELDGRASQRTEEVVKTFERAGIPCTARTDIWSAIWEKFGAFVALVGTETAARLPAGPLRSCPEAQELMKGILEETAAVAEATGIKLKESYVEDALLLINEVAPPTHMGSMYVDLLAGKRLEVDAINGALVRIGKEHGVPTPFNLAVYALLKPYADGVPELP